LKKSLKAIKLKGFKTEYFQPTREEVVGDLFPLKGNGIQNFFKMITL
jgi:hypothetical protein